MAERFHDTQFPSQVAEALAAASLRHDLGPVVTMIARCGACHVLQGEPINAPVISECLDIERTSIAHGLKRLVTDKLLERAPKEAGPKKMGRATANYRPTTAAQPAFGAMPPLSGCMVTYDAIASSNCEACPATTCPLLDSLQRKSTE